MKIKSIIILFLCHVVQLLGAQNDSIFSKANEAYADENYSEAFRLYKSIEKQDVVSGELFYNMGNTAYKLDLTAESIYYFEKALKLSPTDAAILNNLAYAERMRLDQFEVAPDTDINIRYKQFLSFFTLDAWAIFAILCLGLSCVCFALFLFKSSTKTKRLFFIGFAFFLLLSIGSYVTANSRLHLDLESTYAINFQQEKDILEEPNPNALTLLQIHPGTKVKLLDEFRTFYKVELPNGTIGWLDKANLKKI